MTSFLSILTLSLTLVASLHSSAQSPLVKGKAFDRFITIWLENEDFDQVSHDSAIVELKSQGILLTRFYALTHPSQPNYLAAISGDYFGLDHDGFVRIPANVSTVVDLLDTKNISWAGYFEDVPGPGFMYIGSDGQTGSGWDYVRKHNPFVSYNSITDDGNRLLQLLSFDDFYRALTARQVPQFVWLTPNMMHDGHNTTLVTATSWTRDFLAKYNLLSIDPAADPFEANERTLVALTYDESADHSKPNKIVTLLLGSAIPPALRGTEDSTFYTHYSTLSTIQNNWALPSLGRYDVGANVYSFVADAAPTWSHNRDPSNVASVNNSVSYPGFLNSNTKTHWLPLPAPNTELFGAGGLPVLKHMRNVWAPVPGDTPYDGSGTIFDGGSNIPVYGLRVANVQKRRRWWPPV